ncbi:Chitinase 1 [Linum grandiflorum]
MLICSSRGAILFLISLNLYAAHQLLFRDYIAAEGNNVTFGDVPINPSIDFHFILPFAIDYASPSSSSPSPTNGIFKPYWDTHNLGLFQVGTDVGGDCTVLRQRTCR